MAELLGTKLHFVELNEQLWRSKINSNFSALASSKTITADYKVDSAPPSGSSFDNNIIANITSVAADDGIFIMLPAASEGRKLHIWRKDTTSTAVGGQGSLLTNRHIWVVPYLTSDPLSRGQVIYGNTKICKWTKTVATGHVSAAGTSFTNFSHGRSVGDVLAIPSADAANTSMEFFQVASVDDADTITLNSAATYEVTGLGQYCYYIEQANTIDLTYTTTAEKNSGLNVVMMCDGTHWHGGLSDN